MVMELIEAAWVECPADLGVWFVDLWSMFDNIIWGQ